MYFQSVVQLRGNNETVANYLNFDIITFQIANKHLFAKEIPRK